RLVPQLRGVRLRSGAGRDRRGPRRANRGGHRVEHDAEPAAVAGHLAPGISHDASRLWEPAHRTAEVYVPRLPHHHLGFDVPRGDAPYDDAADDGSVHVAPHPVLHHRLRAHPGHASPGKTILGGKGLTMFDWQFMWSLLPQMTSAFVVT